MKIYKKLILVLIAMSMLIIWLPKNVNAGLQANKGGTSLVNQTASNFFTLIKGMEIGTMGLTSTTNIDCHMAKNTEWGTAAILAACPTYGVVPTGENSTTGNASGIYQMGGGKNEFTTGVLKGSTSGNLTNITVADGKYRNEYESSSTRWPGDALSMGSGSFVTNNCPAFLRGAGSLFGYDYSRFGGSYYEYGSRAVVACWAGL